MREFASKNSIGLAINASGCITGQADSFAFLYDGEKMQNLGAPPGKWFSRGVGINANRWVVGEAGVPFDERSSSRIRA